MIDNRYYAGGLEFALDDIKEIEKTKTLLNGHFSLVAKRHKVKVKELKNAYNLSIKNN